MNKTEKQIRLCMRILYRLVRRWYEEQGITSDNCPYDGIKQYGSLTLGYHNDAGPVCNLTLKKRRNHGFEFISEEENV